MHRLTAHPAAAPQAVTGVQVRIVKLPGGGLLLRWRVDRAQKVCVPAPHGRGRADDLWKTTCFEIFLDMGEGRYREFNFSPSGEWAAWDFSTCRVREGDAPMAEEPGIEFDRGQSILVGAIRLPADAYRGARGAALCAVIEEEGGHLSYWAARHAKDRPDFHDQPCFDVALNEVELS